MGPAVGSSSTMSKKPEDPPTFGADKYEFRREVITWVSYLKSAAEARDKVASAKLKTLIQTLVCSLPIAYRQAVEHQIATGAIQVDDSSLAAQEKGVVQVVKIVASDTPTESVDRISIAFKKVYTCKRSTNEDVTTFTARFVGLASRYLMLAGADQHSKDSRLLALCLLQNATLDQTTLNAVKIQIINAASVGQAARNIARQDRTVAVSEYEELKRHMADAYLGLKTVIRRLSLKRPVTPNVASAALTVMKKAKSAVENMDRAHDDGPNATARSMRTQLMTDAGKEVIFYLEDAQAALSAIDTPASGPATTGMTEETVRALYSKMHQQSQKDRTGGKGQSANEHQPKPRITCDYCGKHGHPMSDCRKLQRDRGSSKESAESLKEEYERKLQALQSRKRPLPATSDSDEDVDITAPAAEGEDSPDKKKRKIASLFHKRRRD
jgi:hypothetical protein